MPSLWKRKEIMEEKAKERKRGEVKKNKKKHRKKGKERGEMERKSIFLWK